MRSLLLRFFISFRSARTQRMVTYTHTGKSYNNDFFSSLVLSFSSSSIFVFSFCSVHKARRSKSQEIRYATRKSSPMFIFNLSEFDVERRHDGRSFRRQSQQSSSVLQQIETTTMTMTTSLIDCSLSFFLRLSLKY